MGVKGVANMSNQNETQTRSNNIGGASANSPSAPLLEPVKVILSVGRWKHTIEHRWLFSLRKRGWVKSHCHGGSSWACDYFVLAGRYLLFALSGYTDKRGATFSVTKVTISSDGRLHEGKRLMDVDLPFEYYEYAASDPNAPEVVRDFLAGRPHHYHGVSSDAPAKTYATRIDVSAIQRYFSQLVADS